MNREMSLLDEINAINHIINNSQFLHDEELEKLTTYRAKLINKL